MKDNFDLSHIRFSGATRSSVSVRRNPRSRFSFTNPGRISPQAHGEACTDLNESLASILSYSGVNPHIYRPTCLERRVPACLRALRAHSLSQAQQQVLKHPELAAIAVDSLLLGVTSFFRDPEIFTRLERDVIPVWQGCRAKQTGLRILSVGCSDGHELYSVAIILHRLGMWPPDLLLGLDCRPRAIAHAREGLYAESEVRYLPPAHSGYFRNVGDRMQIIEPLRGMAQWQCGDLGHFREKSFDIVLFRNVAIYFQPAFGEHIWGRILDLVNPDGLLITGKAERPTPGLPFRRLHSCIYQKLANL